MLEGTRYHAPSSSSKLFPDHGDELDLLFVSYIKSSSATQSFLPLSPAVSCVSWQFFDHPPIS